ncbi:acetate--CoA ligase [Desulfovibrio sp. JC022]|uniref:acetate--CoA ligase n=1 Tax=Desulfovibrio sp. JC022 TaxID=2593642 RepID=UPI0013D6C33D|nr:acetate--CoA ligase [Desulfovibrio sp. JC022]NDV22115.1 acetate--CoA ligase [Desulfovibrio sp. JC022]
MSDNRIENLMTEERTFDPPQEMPQQILDKANLTANKYEQACRMADKDPEAFWAERARELLHWKRDFKTALESDPQKNEYKWFSGGRLNASENCLDRHLENGKRNKAALIWQGEPEEEVRVFTYHMLHRKVCRFANVLKKMGVSKGDRVAIYLPMVPELVISMLACARIGAVHSVIFAGFSAVSLQNRIIDCDAKILIAADGVLRGGKTIPLKRNVDEALFECPSVEQVIMVKRTGSEIDFIEGRDTWWQEEMASSDIEDYCKPESMRSTDPLFILHTSGSTGKPKGIVHSTGGYMTITAHTTQWVFDLKDDDVHWCTADIGWITGHSYTVYGPLALGATTLLFEGVPAYPRPDRYWEIINRYGVNIFYTTPTAIRALMREGSQWTEKYELSTLRILGSVGEPINPEVWVWFHEHIGKGKLPLLDTWWQTETGGILISPLPYVDKLKPGSTGKPLPGISTAIVRSDGNEASPNEGGHLLITKPWPGMLTAIHNDKERYRKTYFERFPGSYETGDGARIDEDGFHWIMGRLDDVINVSGHRLGTTEIESALIAHPDVTEAAVVGIPHEIKGQSVYAYVTLRSGLDEDDEMRAALCEWISEKISPIAVPEAIQFSEGLPKTRSGKIMRRILRRIAVGENDLGDTTTLSDASVINDLIEGQKILFE